MALRGLASRLWVLGFFGGVSILASASLAILACGPKSRNLVVSASGDGDCRTIGEALGRARPGAEIRIRPGTYHEALTLSEDVRLIGDVSAGPVVIVSDSSHTVLVRGGAPRLVDITLRCEDTTVDLEEDGHAAAATSGGSPHFVRCVFTSAQFAGAYVTGAESSPSFEDCRFENTQGFGLWFDGPCHGTVRGGMIHHNTRIGAAIGNGADPTLEGVEVAYQTAAGVLAQNARPTLLNCDIHENAGPCLGLQRGADPVVRGCKIHSGFDAGVVVRTGSRGTIEDCEFQGNRNTDFAVEDGSDPTVRRCRIHDSPRVALEIREEGQGTFEDCVIEDTSLTAVAVSFGARPTFRRCRIRNCGSQGIHFEGRAFGLLEDCEISGTRDSGVVSAYNSEPTLRRCRINAAGANGIQVHTWAHGVFEDCEITDSAWSGVAVSLLSTATLRGCRITGGAPYGVRVFDQSSAAVERCDLRGNRDGSLSVEPGSHAVDTANTVEPPPPDARSFDRDLVVSATGDGDFRDVEAALQVAYPGRTVRIRPAIYDVSATVAKPLTLEGEGPRDQVILRNLGVALVLRASSTVRHATLRCNWPSFPDGDGYPAIIIAGTPATVEDCVLTSSSACAVRVDDGARGAVLRQCLVRDCAQRGVFVWQNSSVTLTDCEIVNCGWQGVHIYGGAEATLLRTRAHSGRTNGLSVVRGSRALADDCEFTDNNYPNVWVDAASQATLRRCRVVRSAFAGLTASGESQVSVEGSVISDNLRGGVEIYAGSWAVFRDTEIKNNGAQAVALMPTCAATVTGCDLRGNRGGAWNVQPGATLNQSGNTE
jgi:hypothetical protein